MTPNRTSCSQIGAGECGKATTTAALSPTATRAPARQPDGFAPEGRAKPASTSTSGYSQTALKIAGATKALNEPPRTPPSDIQK